MKDVLVFEILMLRPTQLLRYTWELIGIDFIETFQDIYRYVTQMIERRIRIWETEIPADITVRKYMGTNMNRVY